MRSIWNDGVEVSRLRVNEVKLLGLQDGLFLCLGTFEGDVLGYKWQQCFQELVQEYPIIKLDLAHTTMSLPVMDVVGYVGPNVLVTS